MNKAVKFMGMPGSPYTRKMLALLRYRHINYEMLLSESPALADLPQPKVKLLPTFYLENEQGNIEAVVDSTPLIRRFEASHAGRSVLPGDPALAFINYLLEDYGDEWLTKPMFHYRWHYQDDIDMAAAILPRWRGLQLPEAQLHKLGGIFSERQIGRLYVVGSNDITAPVIEDSYKRFLDIMNDIVEAQAFLFGSRPSSADFAIYAQLTQLAKFDPTPMKICLQRAPRVYAWVDVVDDLSGQTSADDGWLSRDKISSHLGALLNEVGRVYVPFLLANAKAAAAGEKTFETEIDGRKWQQPVFIYQGKCLGWIREEFNGLSGADQAWVSSLLAGTGCEALLS